MTNLPPPPPPPSPPPPPAPWYRTTSGAIGMGVMAALVGGVIYLVISSDNHGIAGATTTSGSSTTAASTVASSSSTAAASTTSSTTTATSTTAAPTTTTTATTTTTTVTATTLALDYSLPANFGEYSLNSGFVPDPAQYDATSGGAVDASYLGGGCYGYASAAPDVKLNYTSGAFPTLRFYFVASTAGADTVLIINTPGGSYLCNDDSWGTLNPTLDFSSPAAGRYDIWVASVTPGANHAGALYVTENTSNHP